MTVKGQENGNPLQNKIEHIYITNLGELQGFRTKVDKCFAVCHTAWILCFSLMLEMSSNI